MAERRMFARSIIDSARFLKMPVSTQALYFHLCLRADDDGVVEAWSVLQITNTSEDDLRVLASKGFVVVLNEDLVSYISDWTTHNKLRPDRKVDSAYQELLLRIVPEADVITPKQRADRLKLPSGTSQGQQVDVPGTDIGPLSIGEDRLDQDRRGEYTGVTGGPPPASAPARPSAQSVRKKHGKYGWVKLSEEEYHRLLNDLGQAEVERCIAYIDESAQTTGNKNKWRDWNLVLRKCSRNSWGRTCATREAAKSAADYESGESFV